MNTKRFEYHSKDVPFVKKDVALRLLFTILFAAVFLWQVIAIFVSYNAKTISTLEMVVGTITLLVTIFMALMSFAYCYKSLMILTSIKQKGKAVRNVAIIGSVKNKSYIRLYQVVTTILTWVMVMVFACALTYTILEIIYYSSVSFYIPVLLLITISGFNSSYHVKNEVATLNEVNQFYSY